MLFKYLETINIGDSKEANETRGALIYLAINTGTKKIDLSHLQLTVKHSSPYEVTSLLFMSVYLSPVSPHDVTSILNMSVYLPPSL